MASLAEALTEHGQGFLDSLPNPLPPSLEHLRQVISLITRCRTGALGGVHYKCDRCGREHWAGRSCGNRHCATCGHEKTQVWIEKQSRKLMPVHHFLVTFTVPRELALVLRGAQREGYRSLFDASSQSIRDVAAATKSLKDCQLGFFGVLHTWGRDIQTHHPHIHYVVPGGGVKLDENGVAVSWQSTPEGFLFHHATLVRVYKAKLADELRRCNLYDRVPSAVWQQTFVVDIQAVGGGESTLKYLAPYVHRVAISDKRIVSVDRESVRYTVRPSNSNVTITKRLSGLKFVAAFCQHILPKGFQKIRHYGWMSPNSRVSLDEAKWLVMLHLGWVYWLASGYAPQPKPLTTPLCCTDCGGPMRVTAVTFDPMLLPRGPPAATFASA